MVGFMKIRSILFFLLILLVANLWAVDSPQPSKKELFLRARDALKESLASGDMERAETAYGYLKQNVENGAPLNLFEEYLAGMELKHFEDGIHAYGVVRRMMLDTAFAKPKQKRFSVEDELRVYLYRNLSPFNKKVADSLYARVDSSSVTQEYKDLYKTLLYSELVLGIRTVPVENSSALFLVIADTTCAEEFLESSKSFVEKYPLSEHSAYLKDDIIPFVQNYVDKKRLFREDPLAHKYYSGGIGLHFYKWLGLLGGKASDFLEDKMGSSFMFDVTFRKKRVSVNWFTSYGLITKYNYELYKPELKNEVDDDEITGKLEELTMGAYCGFTAYDSKYLRVEPFVGASATYYYNLLNHGPFVEFLWGSNVDYRFYATKPERIGGKSFAFMLRFKYMMQIGALDDVCCNDSKSMSVVRHSFGLGLGAELW